MLLLMLETRRTFMSYSQEIVIYVHGYYNCIANIVRSSDMGCNCSVGQDVRSAYGLIDQFERASTHQPGLRGWVFVAAEVAYDQANDSPGTRQ